MAKNRSLHKNIPDLMNWYNTLSSSQLKQFIVNYGITGVGELIPKISTSDWFSQNCGMLSKANHVSKVMKGWKFKTYSAKIVDVYARFCEYCEADVIIFRLEVTDANGRVHEMWKEFTKSDKAPKYGTIARLKQNFCMTTSHILDPIKFVGQDVKVILKSLKNKPYIIDINIMPN